MKVLYLSSPRAGSNLLMNSIVSVMPNFMELTGLVSWHTTDIDIAAAVSKWDLTHILILLRRDMIRQAISTARAHLSKNFHTQDDKGRVKSDFDIFRELGESRILTEIRAQHQGIEIENTKVLDVLLWSEIPVLSLFYEDFQCPCGLKREIARVFGFLGMQYSSVKEPKCVLKKKSDFYTELLYMKYTAYLKLKEREFGEGYR